MDDTTAGAGGVTAIALPTPAERDEVTMADLVALLDRVNAAAERMSAKNEHRELMIDCGWWLHQLARRVVALQQAHDEQAKKARESRIVRPW